VARGIITATKWARASARAARGIATVTNRARAQAARGMVIATRVMSNEEDDGKGGATLTLQEV
jgi:hypothetical protein